jgi:hypothetical protein
VCRWVHLPDEENPSERVCPEEGAPYCVAHDTELHWHTWRELEGREKSERMLQGEENWRKAERLIEFPKRKISSPIA